ncbi:MAG: ribosome silencing factor [Bryobacteraceae bacterium]
MTQKAIPSSYGSPPAATPGDCAGRQVRAWNRRLAARNSLPLGEHFGEQSPTSEPGVVRYQQEPDLTKAQLEATAAFPAADPTWTIAVRAAESKQATDIKVLDLTGITTFADYFVICTGSNQRQIQAIADEVGLQLKRQAGELAMSLEGYDQGEWILADYGDVLVHVFSVKARSYYDLERLWRNAKLVEIPPE